MTSSPAVEANRYMRFDVWGKGSQPLLFFRFFCCGSLQIGFYDLQLMRRGGVAVPASQ